MLKILKKRQFKLLLACISLLVLLDLIQDTYAKYVSSASAEGDFSIASWAFVVNQQDVLANSDFSNTITPTFDVNSNIASGVIAPTSTGYFDITIDATDVGVSYDEVITLSNGEDNTVTDLVFTGYKINNDNNITSLNNVNTATISRTHLLTDQNRVTTYRFYIMWNDNSLTETMDNEDDTEASQDGVASVAVNINFIQNATGSIVTTTTAAVTPTPDPEPEPEPDPEPEP